MRTGFVVSILFSQLLVVSSLSQALAGPCVAPPLTDQAIADFKANPKAVIAPDADARTVEALVRDLAGTDATLAADLVSLASGATPRFRTAIAAGLAQAAVACTNIDQHASLLIQQAVAGFEDGEFQNAFAAVAGDLFHRCDGSCVLIRNQFRGQRDHRQSEQIPGVNHNLRRRRLASVLPDTFCGCHRHAGKHHDAAGEQYVNCRKSSQRNALTILGEAQDIC